MMASLKSLKANPIRPKRIFDSRPNGGLLTPPPMKINKKLDFDSCSEEDVPRSSSPDHNDLRKKLIFDYMEDEDELELSDAPSSPFKTNRLSHHKLINSALSPIESRLPMNNNNTNTCSGLLEFRDLNTSHETSMTSSEKFSPCRTRSGKIYTSVEKRKENNLKKSSRLSTTSSSASAPAPVIHEPTTSSASKLPTPIFIDAPRECSSRHASGASGCVISPHSTRIQTSHLRVQEVQLNLLQRDVDISMDETEEPPAPNEPPPLNYSKRPVSRLLHINVDHHYQIPVATPEQFISTNPWQFQTPANPHSPPTNEVKAMRLFDKSPTVLSSPHTTQRLGGFNASRQLINHYAEDRRESAPAGLRSVTFGGGDSLIAHHAAGSYTTGKKLKRKRVANINPFTPTSMLASLKKKYKSEPEMHNICNSFVAHQPDDHSAFEITGNEADVDQDDVTPAKRLRVSDIDIRRYEEEFVEIKEIASGSFGKVKIARHCLDGMVYAIKVTRNKIHGNTHEERVAMTEVFAHSSLMKHKHVVRYYNSWVENGHIYIQNEYCEGGSLANLIKEYRKMGRRLPESELKRILLHIAKGLQYIHSKQLVHLDIKPENIFISLDHLTPSPFHQDSPSGSSGINCPSASHRMSAANNVASSKAVGATLREVLGERGDCGSGNDSTDSGHASGCDGRFGGLHNLASASSSSGGVDERISYKIGDLGHVSPIYGDAIPEEGDCRYMAPELLTDDIDRTMLSKADIFSLGLTLYEMASLQELPRNSLESSMYERLKSGDLPFIEGYSKEFNALLKSMVHPDQCLRPTATKIVSHSFLRSNSMSKTRSQLYKELRETKAKLRQLEIELMAKKNPNLSAAAASTSASASWLDTFPASPQPMRHREQDSSSPLSSPFAPSPKPKFGNKLLDKSKRRLIGRGTLKSYSCIL